MGKLNIAHHKSYHPYRRDNIERVRRDEEEARQKEAREEGRMMLADSEARIDKLRELAGSNKTGKNKGRDDDMAALTAGSSQPAALPTSGGHINFFEDLEQNAIAIAAALTKKTVPADTEKGVPLAPSAKDLKPWYSERTSEREEESIDERKQRDMLRKSVHDPLTSITHQLASRSSASSSKYRPRPPPRSFPSDPPSSSSTSRPAEVQVRLVRESSERERALELIRRKKREMEGSCTPSTVHGDFGSGYGDVYNRKEVEEAHRGREKRWGNWDRGWGDDGKNRNRGHDGRSRQW